MYIDTFVYMYMNTCTGLGVWVYKLLKTITAAASFAGSFERALEFRTLVMPSTLNGVSGSRFSVEAEGLRGHQRDLIFRRLLQR